MRASLMCHPKKVSITNSKGSTFSLIEGYNLPNIYRIENMTQTSISNIELTEEGEFPISNTTTFSYTYSDTAQYIINYSILTDNKTSKKYINDDFCGTILQDGSIEIETDLISLNIKGDGSTVTINVYKLKCLGVKINTVKTYTKTLYRAAAPLKSDLVLPSNCVILDLPTVSKGIKTNLQANVYKIKDANGTYVAFIYNYESSAYEIVYSKDGYTWGKTSGINEFAYNADFVYANGIWSLIVSSGFYYSTDGITWINTNDSITWKASNIHISFGASCNYDDYIHMAYANGIYLASAGSIAYNGVYGHNLFYSTDGKTWIQSSSSERVKFIEHTKGYWFTASTGSIYAGYNRSQDGIGWTGLVTNWGPSSSYIINQISFDAHRGIVYSLYEAYYSSQYYHYLSISKTQDFFTDIQFVDMDQSSGSYTGKIFPTSAENSNSSGKYDLFYGCGKFIARSNPSSWTDINLHYSNEGKYMTKAKVFKEYSCPVCRQGSYGISRYSSNALQYQNCQNTLCIIQASSTYADGSAIAYTEDAKVWRFANINNPYKVQNTWFVTDDDGYVYTYETNHTLIPNYTEVEYDKI